VKGLHIGQVITDILKRSGVKNVTESFVSKYPDIISDRVERWKRKHKLVDGEYVLFHAGCSSKWPTKRWPREYFAQLAKMVTEYGYKCVWLGGPEDVEINSFLEKSAGINAVNEFNVIELLILGRGALCAVCNDSGPSHILGISGTPVHTFFGPSNWKQSHPIGNKSRAFHTSIDCSPCFQKTCSNPNKLECMLKIEPKQVFSKIINE